MARINGTSSKNGYGFYALLTETLGENYLSTNITTVNYEVYIVNNGKRTESSNWTFNAKIDGTNVYNKTSQTLKTNDVDYDEAKLLFSGSKSMKHNDDGTKTITFSASLTKSTSYSSHDPGKCELSGEFKLTNIPRASGITSDVTYVSFGKSVKIDIDRQVDSYTDTLTWVGYIPVDTGDGNYSVYGTPSKLSGTIYDEETKTTCEKTKLKSVTWAIPEELSSLIPEREMVGVKVTCTTYNGNEVVGTSECWIIPRLFKDIACPIINKSYVETNAKVINQLGKNDFSIPVLNVSQPKFTFSATPRYNATIKSIKIVCDDGQTATTSPHTFNPIGKAEFSIVAVDSRGYDTTTPIDLSATAIPYIKPTIKKLEPTRLSPVSGEIILNANGDWYGGTMINDIGNEPSVGYRCKINGSEDDAQLIDIPKSAIKTYAETNTWEIKNYNLGNITEYNKNYNFTLFIGDYYLNIEQNKLIRKGISTFNAGEKDFQVNGDLYIADEDGENKKLVNVFGKASTNLFNKNNITNARSYASDGTDVQLSNGFIQESFIPVESSTNYIFSTASDLTNVTNGRTVIMEYDNSFNFIKRNLVTNSGTLTITTTNNTKYVRVGGSTIGIETYQFEKGNTRTTYEAYYEPILSVKNGDFQNVPYVKGKITKNLFRLNNSGVTSNGLTSVVTNNNVRTTGTSNTNTWANITNRVYDILPAGTYTFSVDKTRSAARITLRVYTSETEYQNFEIKENELSKTFTIGSNIVSYYLYFWNLTNGNSYDFSLNFQLEKGSKSTGYEKHFEPTISIMNSNNEWGEDIEIVNHIINDKLLVFDTSKRIAITPQNGTNHANYGGSYYYKVGTKVHLHLGVGGLTANTNVDIVTLPAGYRPNHILGAYGLSNNLNSTCSMQISAGGIVSVRPSSTYALVDFEFDAVQ